MRNAGLFSVVTSLPPVILIAVTLHSLKERRRNVRAAAALRGNICVRFASTSWYLSLQHGPHPPFPPPSQACLPQNPPPSVFPYHFLVCRSLILLQNRDVEKDAIVHHQNVSRPNSEHSLDLSDKLQNPLAGKDKETLEEDAIVFCGKHGLMEHGT